VTAGEVLPDLSACRELASALRAGDDSAAAGLAARTGIPRWLLTHPELGPCGRLDAGDAGEALGYISVLAAGRAVDLVPWPAKPAVIDLLAEAVETASAPGTTVGHPWARGIAALEDCGHVAREINHELGYLSVLGSRDAADLTPAEAVAAGGAALDRVLAMIDDCDWRLRRAEAEGKDTSMLPDPGELRRRLGIPAGSRRAVT
jgi:hypothetical protein